MKTEWISIKDQLPPYKTEVIVFADGEVTLARLQESRTVKDGEGESTYHDFQEIVSRCDVYVSHWMPLPEPPEGVNN